MLVAALAVVTLVSCSKSNTNTNPLDGESDLLIQFSETANVSNNTSKGAVAPVTGGKVSFVNGALFITDGAGEILNYVLIGNGAAAVSVPQLENGYVMRKVKNTAEVAYIIGNFDFTATGVPATFSNISDVQDLTTDLMKQQDLEGGVVNASLYGAGVLMPSGRTVTVGGESITINREVQMTVTPLISRIELNGITADQSSAAKIDPAYNLAGIYLNNYYFEVDVTGVATSPLINHGMDYTKYLREELNGEYKTEWFSYLFDDGGYSGGSALPLGASDGVGAVKPSTDGSKTWAYNFLAEPSANPHIILHLTDVKESGTLRPNAITGKAGEAYLTVNRFLDKITGAIAPILVGKVYKINDIKFDVTDLTDVPETGGNSTYEVLVEIDLLEWQVFNVDAGLDK